MRLDKYIASCTGMTRKEIKKALRKNPASVSGGMVSEPDFKVSPDTEVIFLGEKLNYSEYTYILMNKPAGFVCSNREGKSPTVFSLLSEKPVKNLFTVGRLDKDTTGLLLITDDGDFSHKMLSPKRHVDKTYYLTTDKEIPEEAVTQFRSGVDIGDEKPTKSAVLEISGREDASGDRRCAYLTIHEGRFHQVKRMMETVGCRVTSLQRISMGKFTLDDMLKEGEYRYFTEEELEFVKKYKG